MQGGKEAKKPFLMAVDLLWAVVTFLEIRLICSNLDSGSDLRRFFRLICSNLGSGSDLRRFFRLICSNLDSGSDLSWFFRLI